MTAIVFITIFIYLLFFLNNVYKRVSTINLRKLNLWFWFCCAGAACGCGDFLHLWSVTSVPIRKCVWLTSLTPSSFYHLSKVLKCANMKHDTYSMKRRRKKWQSVVLRFLPSQGQAHKSSACNAWTMSAASRLIRRMLTSGITLAALVLFIPMFHCSIERGTVCLQMLSMRVCFPAAGHVLNMIRINNSYILHWIFVEFNLSWTVHEMLHI